MPPQRFGRTLAEGARILRGKTAELRKTVVERDRGDARPPFRLDERPARPRKAQLSRPGERGRPEELPEMRLEGARRHAGGLRQPIEPHRLVQMAAQPGERTHDIARQGGGGLGIVRVHRHGRADPPGGA
jgi:hypothetical protein